MDELNRRLRGRVQQKGEGNAKTGGPLTASFLIFRYPSPLGAAERSFQTIPDSVDG
jgi:hypothetical protein